ncbi:MAG: ribonuclease H-like domain-containing protein [Anaerolineaceae bacterium]|nr:ribonuclease H-like domain-containing protein [Anaerolineaceae bacterium]
MTQLSDKLKALGVQLGASSLNTKPKQKSIAVSLSQVVSGDYTYSDQVFETVEVFDSKYQHGNFNLWLHTFKKVKHLLDVDFRLQDLIFIDAETTGLSGGAGTFAFMLGLGWFDQSNAFHVKQLFLPEPANEYGFLASLTDELARFSTLVSFNGKSFDVPLLRNRYILHSATSPFKSMAHIDLLHLARRIWRYRLPSRTLGELEAHILHFPRGEDELPGWMAPKLYIDYLKTGDASPMKGMFYHNQIDILSLAALLCAIEKVTLLDGNSASEMYALAELFESKGDISNAKEAFERTTSLEKDLDFSSQAYHRLGMISRRAGDWSRALSFWKKAAISRPEACIELAKYYEHQARDYNEAEHWCKKAMSLSHQAIASKVKIKEVEYRLKRVIRKRNAGENFDPARNNSKDKQHDD